MELRQLKYFTVLASELNFSHAAQKLFISQGTLSQQIKQLENEIGADLFERSSHSVVLTESGEELLQYAKKTLEAAHECSQVANDLNKGIVGTLNIGATHSFKYLMRNTVKEFIKRYPGIDLRIIHGTANELLNLLRERKVDFFLAFQPEAKYPDLESIELINTQLAVIMRHGHPYADKKSITKEELLKQHIALPARGLQSRKAVEKYVGDTSRINVAVETNDPIILLEIISSTNLLSITSTLAIKYRDDLVAVPLEGVSKTMTGCIHRLKDTYIKRSSSLFTKMLMESADLERMMG